MLPTLSHLSVSLCPGLSLIHIFKDLFCGPALRTIELYHIAMALFVLELINAVLIAV